MYKINGMRKGMPNEYSGSNFNVRSEPFIGLEVVETDLQIAHGYIRRKRLCCYFFAGLLHLIYREVN